MKNRKLLLIYFLFSFSVMLSQAQTFQKEQDGIVLNTPSNAFSIKKIKLKVWKDDIIRVIVSPQESFSDRKSLTITEKINDIPQWNVEETTHSVNLTMLKEVITCGPMLPTKLIISLCMAIISIT
jgi:Domain of unknown function (DUF4968)